MNIIISHGNIVILQYRILLYRDSDLSGIRIIEECESTKKIKNPGQITFVHTMRSIRLNRRLGAERHAKSGGMNHRQIIGSIANRNSLTLLMPMREAQSRVTAISHLS